jgi:hypothetical protein
MNFKKNMPVVKILAIAGLETAVVTSIAVVKGGKVQPECDEHIWYDARTGAQIDSPMPGVKSRLVKIEE